MARFYGSAVKTGKLGASVFAIRNGAVIERQYQPVVANPSTPAQVEARAKLKLLSQLSAVMAPVITMKRVGTMSPRNRFLKANYGAASFENGEADITLANVKITNSVVSLIELSATRESTTATVSLAGPQPELSRVVYAFFAKMNDNTLRYVGSEVATAPGSNNLWQVTHSVGDLNYIVYAYGVRDNSDAARTIFGDMQTPTADTVAKLLVSSKLTEADVTLTETKFASLTRT